MSIIIGVLAWLVVFVGGATLIHEPDTAYWGGFFIGLCGVTLGIALSRLP